MSTINVPDEIITRLVQGARRRGYGAEPGEVAYLIAYLEHLVSLDEALPLEQQRSPPLHRALGLLTRPGQSPVTDVEIQVLLDQRRMGRGGCDPQP